MQISNRKNKKLNAEQALPSTVTLRDYAQELASRVANIPADHPRRKEMIRAQALLVASNHLVDRIMANQIAGGYVDAMVAAHQGKRQ